MAFARPPEPSLGFRSLHAGSFRQRSGSFADVAAGGRGVGRPYFVGAYRPPVDSTDTIRLHDANCKQAFVVGNDQEPSTIRREYWEFIHHWDHMTKTGVVCSAGPWVHYRDRRSGCRGCDLYWNTVRRDGNGKLVARVDKRTKFAFSVLDYGKYHFVPEVDHRGRQVVHSATRAPFGSWTKCEGPMCQACRDPSVEHKTGHTLHWPMSWTHFQQMRAMARDIGDTCAGCGNEGSIQSLAWVCSNPACGEVIIDMTARRVEPKELTQIIESPHLCPKCDAEDFPEEIIECSSCSRPRRVGLFDVDLRVKRVPVANASAVLTVHWSAPRPIPERFQHLAEPVDLATICQPTPVDVQERLFRWKPERSGESSRAPAG